MVERVINPRPRKTQIPHKDADHVGVSTAPDRQLVTRDGDYPDKLDARLLWISGVCVLARLMVILDITVVAVAQRTFIAQFGSSQAVVAWTITGYTMALATVIPLAGWAADRFGTKRLFMGSVLFFTLGSLLCAMAPNITLLIGFRILEGLGGGMLLPLKYTIMTQAAGPNRLGRLMAVAGVPTLLSPICDPVVGGWLIEAFGWQWIFLVNVPIGVTAFLLAGVIFPKDRTKPSEAFDVVGMLLLSPGLAAFLYGVSSIPGRATVADIHIWPPVGIGVLLIAGFVLHTRYRAAHPLIDLRLFKDHAVALANAALLLSETAYLGATLLFPSCFQQLLHQTPLQSGLHLIPKGIGAMLTIPTAGYIMDRYGPAKVVPIGVTLTALGMGTFAYGVWNGMDYSPTLLAGLMIMGMGMGCTLMPLWAAALRPLRPHQVARGSTLLSVNHQVAASVGTALMSAILTSQFARSGNIIAANKLAALRQTAASHGASLDPSAIPRRALLPDFTSAVQHDLSHAYGLVFAVAVVMITLMYLPVALLARNSLQPKTSPGTHTNVVT
ncbi:DHA2 family efflux MFS transporter permease subunit [Mycobacterium botniense]|uniref:Multidrug resistance protein B n=1 Tax=Mycobacterium botniense TaxID=84962 RepID=A0A7I9XX54_9MYCO|nr:multidrug resistance protein B [Mycobacterium botniense]